EVDDAAALVLEPARPGENARLSQELEPGTLAGELADPLVEALVGGLGVDWLGEGEGREPLPGPAGQELVPEAGQDVGQDLRDGDGFGTSPRSACRIIGIM
ncbi:MAG: hypothetical protein ACRENJ_00620, partial [Candidatus Eiseniibacteriota bacterium]